MPYGIRTASTIFQRSIKQVIEDNVENIVYYQDDIIGVRNRN